MDADVDLLFASVFVAPDDLLLQRQNSAAHSVTDAEVVTLCVPPATMGIPFDRRSWRAVGGASITCCRGCPSSPGPREQVLARFCTLAAAITLNHQLGRPSRALVNYCA